MKRIVAAGIVALVMGCGPRDPVIGRVAASPPAPKVVAGDLDGTILLGDLPKLTAKAGGGTTTVVATGLIAEGERLGAFVEVPAEMCLLAYARASSSVDDLDVVVFAEEGNPIAADEGPDPRPAVIVCPPHPARVYVAAHGAGGEGLVTVAAELVPPGRAGDVAKLAGAHGGPGESVRPADAWPGLDEKLRAHRTSLGGTWEDVKRLALPIDARAPSTVPFSAAAGQCLDILILPGEDVANVDVTMFDGGGRELARAKDTGRDRSIVTCTGYAFEGTLELRPHVGQGLAAVVIGKVSRAAAPDLQARVETVWYGTEEPLDKARAALEASLSKGGYASSTVVGTGALTLGRRSTVTGDVPDGGCARLDVVAGAPLTLLTGRVRDDKGIIRGSGEGAAGATMFACGTKKVNVDLDALGRGGPFAVLARPERAKSDVFGKKPIASARMLARTVPYPGAVSVAVTDVRLYTVDATKVERFESIVAQGTCSELVAGAEGEGTGVFASVTDAVSNDEIDRAHGANSVAIKVCAGGAARKVRFELGATAGHLDVVVGELKSP